ncbi:MAG TPA: hypothetical protein VFY71_18770 [Planctomycetota bacterium]|nr:hypothetical protein [Planctomycetota bacterium]
MTKRLIPWVLATLCALPLATAQQPATGTPAPKTDAVACVVDTLAPDVTALTDVDREAFQFAQRSSDPKLGEQRGGFLGLVIVILLIILIVVLVD